MRFLPLLILPVLFMCLRRATGAYIFSALVTFSCLVIACVGRAPRFGYIALGLAFSIAGDWFLAHIGARPQRFLFGVAGFFLAHTCFLIYVAGFAKPGALTWIGGLLMALGYAVLLARGIYPNAPQTPLRVALALYMLISVCVFALSSSLAQPALPKMLFCAGIFLILFSDTLIGLDRFMGVKSVGKWILPTYYMCHILITASTLCV